MEVRLLENIDIQEIVDIHTLAFENYFLTKLGENFLTIYYKSVLESKNGFILGYFDDSMTLLGFAATTSKSSDFNKNLIINNFISYCFLGLNLVFTKPMTIIRLMKNLKKTDGNFEDDGAYAELLSIGINPRMQGQGLGKVLLIEVENYLRNQGVEVLSLTTDFYDNEQGIGFYSKMGYNKFYDFFSFPNRRMYRFIKKI